MSILLPVCISIAVLGLVVAVLLWARGRRGRALQSLAVGGLPFGLYLTGLLPLVWSGAIELLRWASRLVFNPAVWAGVGLLGLAVVLWVVGGMLSRRTRDPARVAGAAPNGPDRPVTVRKAGKSVNPAKPKAGNSGDAELDEIEAILRQRGIE